MQDRDCYYGRLIGTCMHSIEWCYFQWLWVTHNYPKPPKFPERLKLEWSNFVQVGDMKSQHKDDKSPLKGAWSGSHDPLSVSMPTIISPEQLKRSTFKSIIFAPPCGMWTLLMVWGCELCVCRMRRQRSSCQMTLRLHSVFVTRWYQRRFSTSPVKLSTTVT